MTSKEKYEIVIANWSTKTKEELAEMIGTTPGVVAFMAGEARRNGIKLADKRSKESRVSSGRSVDWGSVKKVK